jgi:FixJ family two-component response regulator
MADAMLVTIVDDDESVRQSVPELVRKFGFSVRAFTSALEFLASDCVDKTKCLILDVAMPGMSGPDLQRELTNRGQRIPIIFLTGQRDPDLFKPFSAAALREALITALGVS